MRLREFLIVYDYGTGGVWGLALASNPAKIREHFPQLRIVAERPIWMDDGRFQKLREASSFVVGEPATYPEWLRALNSR